MTNSYRDILINKILKNKILLFSVILTTILCFGFTITNFSISIDDSAASYYLTTSNHGSMIQQGRLLHILFHCLTGSFEFLPFFNDFLGALLFAFSALIFCSLFQLVTENKISDKALIAFSCVYISYPIIHEKFIFNLDTVVTMSSYCTCALALVLSWLFVQRKQMKYLLLSVLCLSLSIASYETFIFVYFCGVFTIFILEYLYKNESFRLKTILLQGLKYALVAVAALIIYYILVILVQVATQQYGEFQRANVWQARDDGFFTILMDIIRGLYLEFRYSKYFAIREFTIFSIIGFLLFIVLSFRKKNPGLFICYIPFFLGNLLIHFVSGYVVYRTAQTFCFFIAFIVLILLDTIPKKKWVTGLAVIATVWLVFIQSAELNRWFYNDYMRSQKESFAIHAIATELVGNYDVSKPVVFVNDTYYSYLNTAYYSGSQSNGPAVLHWACYAFDQNTTPMMYELFRMHGYDFLTVPNEAQATEAKTKALEMPAWPTAGYIQEFDDYIIIKIG